MLKEMDPVRDLVQIKLVYFWSHKAGINIIILIRDRLFLIDYL